MHYPGNLGQCGRVVGWVVWVFGWLLAYAVALCQGGGKVPWLLSPHAFCLALLAVRFALVRCVLAYCLI